MHVTDNPNTIRISEDILRELESHANTNRGGPPRRPFTDEEIAIIFRGRENNVPWKKICELMEKSSGLHCDPATARRKYRELGVDDG
jgi:hypothetical protein